MIERELVDFRLPDGRIVGIDASVASYNNFVTFQTKADEIVIAERVSRLGRTAETPMGILKRAFQALESLHEAWQCRECQRDNPDGSPVCYLMTDVRAILGVRE